MTTLKALEMELFDVEILQNSYRVEAESRTKAVTLAIQKFREAFPESNLPSGILRFSAKTSRVRTADSLDRETLEELFSKVVKGDDRERT